MNFDQAVLSALAERDFGGGIRVSELREALGVLVSDEAFDLGLRTMSARGLVAVTVLDPGMPEFTYVATTRLGAAVHLGDVLSTVVL